MLAIEAEGRTAFDPINGPMEADTIVEAAALAAGVHGHEWNDGQRVTKGLLTSRAQVTAAQGYAGTAKAKAMLKTYAGAARAQGYTVRAFAKVAAIDGATVRLTDPKGKPFDWRPASWDATSVEAFTEIEAEFRRSDRIQFTRNKHQARLYTDDRAKLTAAIGLGDGAQAAALVTT